MARIEPVVLEGHHLQLEPLAARHHDELRAAADDPRLWEFTVARGFGPHFDRWWNDALEGLEKGHRLPFVVIDRDGAVIGSSSYLNVALHEKRLEIGSTWYVHRLWATAVNPACKLLMMTHAFEVLRIRRVEFCVDAINTRSRAAVRKLGAVEEGILRAHRFTETGRIRSTVYYSVLEDEWPGVKAGLARRLT
jgi:RimJ/RimL family protein N-acetyltransferase